MLQSTSATHSEVPALRVNARGCRSGDLEQLAVIMLSMLARAPEADALTGQRPGDEHRLAVSDDPFTLMGQADDGCFLDDRTCEPARAGAHAALSQRRRNSCRCASREPRSKTLTRSNSS